MKRRLAGLAAASVLLAATAAARAEGPESAPEMRWYGYQALALDATAVGVFALGGAMIGSCHSAPCDGSLQALGLVSLVVYQFGGPTVHALHGHWPRPFYSGLVRFAPIAAALVLPERAVSRLVLPGVVGAIIFDDGFLAHEPVKRTPWLALVPTYESRYGTRGIAATGTF
jgi:hypothetical protein